MAKKKAAPKKAAKKTVPKKAAAKKAAPKKAAIKAAKKSTKSAVTRHVAKAVIPKANFSAIISPLEDRVLVQLETNGGERRSPGGLILVSDSAAVAGHVKAQVVAVGPGKRNKKGQIRPLDLRIGDWVLLAEFGGDDIELNSHKLKIVREGEILGVVGNG